MLGKLGRYISSGMILGAETVSGLKVLLVLKLEGQLVMRGLGLR
jgi:hypothetical protein